MRVESQKRFHVVVMMVLEARISNESVQSVGSVHPVRVRRKSFARFRLVSPGSAVRCRRPAELEVDGFCLTSSPAVDGHFDRGTGVVLIRMGRHLVRSRSEQPPELPELRGKDLVIDPFDLDESLKAFG